MGWKVITKDSVGIASRSGLVGWVVKVVCMGCHPQERGGGVGDVVLVFFRSDDLLNMQLFKRLELERALTMSSES